MPGLSASTPRTSHKVAELASWATMPSRRRVRASSSLRTVAVWRSMSALALAMICSACLRAAVTSCSDSRRARCTARSPSVLACSRCRLAVAIAARVRSSAALARSRPARPGVRSRRTRRCGAHWPPSSSAPSRRPGCGGPRSPRGRRRRGSARPRGLPSEARCWPPDGRPSAAGRPHGWATARMSSASALGEPRSFRRRQQCDARSSISWSWTVRMSEASFSASARTDADSRSIASGSRRRRGVRGRGLSLPAPRQCGASRRRGCRDPHTSGSAARRVASSSPIWRWRSTLRWSAAPNLVAEHRHLRVLRDDTSRRCPCRSRLGARSGTADVTRHRGGRLARLLRRVLRAARRCRSGCLLRLLRLGRWRRGLARRRNHLVGGLALDRFAGGRLGCLRGLGRLSGCRVGRCCLGCGGLGRGSLLGRWRLRGWADSGDLLRLVVPR